MIISDIILTLTFALGLELLCFLKYQLTIDNKLNTSVLWNYLLEFALVISMCDLLRLYFFKESANFDNIALDIALIFLDDAIIIIMKFTDYFIFFS